MYKVVIDSVEIHCDTADEAVEVAARLRGVTLGKNGNSNGQRPVEPGLSRWTETRYRNFSALLKDNQKKMMRELIGNPDGIPDATLRQALGLASNKAFGPILTGISRKAKKVGVSLEDVVRSEKVTMSNGDVVLEFKAVPSFAAVASAAGGMK
jgi:hypothetical protein